MRIPVMEAEKEVTEGESRSETSTEDGEDSARIGEDLDQNEQIFRGRGDASLSNDNDDYDRREEEAGELAVKGSGSVLGASAADDGVDNEEGRVIDFSKEELNEMFYCDSFPTEDEDEAANVVQSPRGSASSVPRLGPSSFHNATNGKKDGAPLPPEDIVPATVASRSEKTSSLESASQTSSFTTLENVVEVFFSDEAAVTTTSTPTTTTTTRPVVINSSADVNVFPAIVSTASLVNHENSHLPPSGSVLSVSGQREVDVSQKKPAGFIGFPPPYNVRQSPFPLGFVPQSRSRLPDGNNRNHHPLPIPPAAFLRSQNSAMPSLSRHQYAPQLPPYQQNPGLSPLAGSGGARFPAPTLAIPPAAFTLTPPGARLPPSPSTNRLVHGQPAHHQTQLLTNQPAVFINQGTETHPNQIVSNKSCHMSQFHMVPHSSASTCPSAAAQMTTCCLSTCVLCGEGFETAKERDAHVALVHNSKESEFVSDGTYNDRNGLWRLFEVLKENGFIPPEVIRAYEIYSKNHPSAGKAVNENCKGEEKRLPTSLSTTPPNATVLSPRNEDGLISSSVTKNGPAKVEMPPGPSALSIPSAPPVPRFLLPANNQNSTPLGPQQVFSCLVPDCVYSTPTIDNYRMHVHIFHPHLQLELLNPGITTFPGKQYQPIAPRPPIHSLLTPGFVDGVGNSVVVEGIGGAGDAMSDRRPIKDRSVAVERAIEMHKCVASDCDYYSESLQGLKMHTRWRHPEISSSAVSLAPLTLVSPQERHAFASGRHMIPLQIKKVMNCIVSTCDYRATSNHALKMHMTMVHPGVDKDELDSKIRSCPIAGCERNGMSLHGLKLHCIRAHPGYELTKLMAESNAMLDRENGTDASASASRKDQLAAEPLGENVNDLTKDFESDGEGEFDGGVQSFDSIEPFDENLGQILPEDPSLDAGPLAEVAEGSGKDDSSFLDRETPEGPDVKPFGCAVPGCNYRAYTSHNMRVHTRLNHPGIDGGADAVDEFGCFSRPKYQRRKCKKIYRCSVKGCNVGRKSLMSLRGLRVHTTLRHPQLTRVDDAGNLPSVVAGVDGEDIVAAEDAGDEDDDEEEDEEEDEEKGSVEEEGPLNETIEGREEKAELVTMEKKKLLADPASETNFLDSGSYGRRVVNKGTDEKPYFCHYEGCGFTAATYQAVNSHKRHHINRARLATESKEFPCPIAGCVKISNGIKGLRVHVTRCHPEFGGSVNDDGHVDEPTSSTPASSTPIVNIKTTTAKETNQFGNDNGESSSRLLRDRASTPSSIDDPVAQERKFRAVYACCVGACDVAGKSLAGIAIHLSRNHGLTKTSPKFKESFREVYTCLADENCAFTSESIHGVTIHLGQKHNRSKSSSPCVATTLSNNAKVKTDAKTPTVVSQSYLEIPNRKSFPCLVPGCNFVSPSFRGLKFHTTAVHSTNDVETTEFGEANRNTEVENHSERSVPCPEDSCQGIFKSEKDLKIHKRRTHPGAIVHPAATSGPIKLRKCPVDSCEYVFKTNISYLSLLTHFKRNHHGVAVPDEFRHKHKCPVAGCSYAAKKAPNLKQHILGAHKDWMPDVDSPWYQELKMGFFACTEPDCTFSCNSPMGMASHRRVHLKAAKRKLEEIVDEKAVKESPTRAAAEGEDGGIEADVEDEDGGIGPSKRVRKQSTLYPSAKEFLCGICDEAFEAASSLTAHTRERHPDRPGCFPCPFCDKLFWSPAFLQSHISLQHEELEDSNLAPVRINGSRRSPSDATVTTSSSRVVLSDIADRLPTLRSPRRDTPTILVCKVCALVFEESEGLDEHMTTCHQSEDMSRNCDASQSDSGAGRSSSSTQGQRVGSPTVMSTESSSLTKDDPRRKITFECPKCNEVLSSDNKLLFHVNSVHGLEAAMNLYPCNKCKKSFRSSYFLNLHFEKFHPNTNSVIEAEAEAEAGIDAETEFSEAAEISWAAAHSGSKPIDSNSQSTELKAPFPLAKADIFEEEVLTSKPS